MKQITNVTEAVAFLEAAELATSKDNARLSLNGLCVRWLESEKVWHVFATDGHLGVDTHMPDEVLVAAYKNITGHTITRDLEKESQVFWLNNARRRKAIGSKSWEMDEIAFRFHDAKPKNFTNDVNSLPWHSAKKVGDVVKIITKIEGKTTIYNRPDSWNTLLDAALWERKNYDILVMPLRKS